MHDVAQLIHMQHETMPETTAGSYLQKIHRLVIDLLHKLFGRIGINDAFFYFSLIFIGIVEQHRVSRLTVSACTSRFLIIRLDGIG